MWSGARKLIILLRTISADINQEEIKTNKKSGYWTGEDQRNIVLFFDEFARERNGNSQDPNFWYTVKRSEIKESKVNLKK